MPQGLTPHARGARGNEACGMLAGLIVLRHWTARGSWLRRTGQLILW